MLVRRRTSSQSFTPSVPGLAAPHGDPQLARTRVFALLPLRQLASKHTDLGRPEQQGHRFVYVHKSAYFGAGHEARTRDLKLGKLALYQLS